MSIPSRRHSASSTTVPPDRPGGGERQLRLAGVGRGGQGGGRVEQPGQRRDQPPDGVAVELVFAAEAVQHLRSRRLRHRIPLVAGQLQVPHRGARSQTWVRRPMVAGCDKVSPMVAGCDKVSAI